MGLLVNERLLNSPPELSPPLFEALLLEACWAVEDQPTQVSQARVRNQWAVKHMCTHVDCM